MWRCGPLMIFCFYIFLLCFMAPFIAHFRRSLYNTQIWRKFLTPRTLSIMIWYVNQLYRINRRQCIFRKLFRYNCIILILTQIIDKWIRRAFIFPTEWKTCLVLDLNQGSLSLQLMLKNLVNNIFSLTMHEQL